MVLTGRSSAGLGWWWWGGCLVRQMGCEEPFSAGETPTYGEIMQMCCLCLHICVFRRSFISEPK